MFLLLSVKIMRPTIAIDVNLVEGRFFQIQLHCGFDQVRMFFVLQFFVYSEFVNSSCYPCFNCWCGLRHGCKGVNLVTSIRQPIHGPHPLILDAPQHRQLDFIFLPSVGPFHLDETGRNPLVNIPSDDGCAAFRERLKFW